MVFREENETSRLAGIHFQQRSASTIEANRFTLDARSPAHYAFLAAGVALPIFSLFTLVRCWRRRPHRRWLWLLFIAVAFPIVTLNWTTGAVSFNLIAFNVLGAGFSQQGALQPLYVQLGAPIGAVLFWLRDPPPRGGHRG
jgi:hypothetical protein